jgi:hypothetical protein
MDMEVGVPQLDPDTDPIEIDIEPTEWYWLPVGTFTVTVNVAVDPAATDVGLTVMDIETTLSVNVMGVAVLVPSVAVTVYVPVMPSSW